MQQVAPGRHRSADPAVAKQLRWQHSWIMFGVAVLSGLLVLGTIAPSGAQQVPVPTFPTTPTPDPLPLIADSGPPVPEADPRVAVPGAALAAPAPPVRRVAPATAPARVEPKPIARNVHRKQSRRGDDARIYRRDRDRGVQPRGFSSLERAARRSVNGLFAR